MAKSAATLGKASELSASETFMTLSSAWRAQSHGSKTGTCAATNSLVSRLTTIRSARAAIAAMRRSGSENVCPRRLPCSRIRRQRNSTSSVTERTRPANSGRIDRSSHWAISERRAGSLNCSMPKRISAKVTSVVNNASPLCAPTNPRTFWFGLGRRSSETTFVSINQPLKASRPGSAPSPTAVRSAHPSTANWPAHRQGRARRRAC